MTMDPVSTNPGNYSVVFENDRVRVLEYRDEPGFASVPHAHPDSVMITLSDFQRRLSTDDHQVEVEMDSGQARWLGAQVHSGHNIGQTPTHVMFVELKEAAPNPAATPSVLGPEPVK